MPTTAHPRLHFPARCPRAAPVRQLTAPNSGASPEQVVARRSSRQIAYHRARYYHPQLRRFLNQDSILGNLGTPASLNRFAYANGNSIRWTDPLGKSVPGGWNAPFTPGRAPVTPADISWSAVGKTVVVVTVAVPVVVFGGEIIAAGAAVYAEAGAIASTAIANPAVAEALTGILATSAFIQGETGEVGAAAAESFSVEGAAIWVKAGELSGVAYDFISDHFDEWFPEPMGDHAHLPNNTMRLLADSKTHSRCAQ